MNQQTIAVGTEQGKFNRQQIALLSVFFLFAFLVRMYDLTDLPLDFAPSRQVRSAMIARSIYYQQNPVTDAHVQEMAVGMRNRVARYEPPMLESMVAQVYRVMGKETLWVSRIFTSLFWLIGGWFLYLLAKRMTSAQGALAAAAYYLFLPLAIWGSRSFQPDPGMVMGIIITNYALYRWSEEQSWRWALVAGLSGGLAVLVKAFAVFFVALPAAAIVLSTLKWRQAWRNRQVWAMAALMIVPPAWYYLGVTSGRASSYIGTWTLSVIHLLIDPAFYVRWLSFLSKQLGLGFLLFAGIGALLVKERRSRALVWGMWGGYAVFGAFVPYQMYTHDYYQLPLIPIVGLSLAWVAWLLYLHLAEQGKGSQLVLAGILAVAVLYPSFVARSELKRADYRQEGQMWQQMADTLPSDGDYVALTQDYGLRLTYFGWRNAALWPTTGDLKFSALRGSPDEFDTMFTNRTRDKQYFLITMVGQLSSQPQLKERLYQNYPLLQQGDGYLLFDLAHPLEQQP